jgi:soluble lytic murein transglycosylase
MSSVARVLILLWLCASAPATAQRLEPLPSNYVPEAPAAQAQPESYSAPTNTSTGDIASTYQQWQSLSKSKDQSFSIYANFLLQHSGWPNERTMRQNAEQNLSSQGAAPALIVRYFQAYPALSASGQYHYAQALEQLGQPATSSAIAAWEMGALRADEENALLRQYGFAITPAQQDARMNRLLAQHALDAAARQLERTSPQAHARFAARLALQSRASDAEAQAQAFIYTAQDDAGFTYDWANWLVAKGRMAEAAAFMARPHAITQPVFNPKSWLTQQLMLAHYAHKAGDDAGAYAIAAQLGFIYPYGTNVMTQSYEERDAYSSLAWLAASLAAQKLNAPAQAAALFETYALATRTGTAQSKGYYWATKAAQASGNAALAERLNSRTTLFFETFYGELAAEAQGHKAGMSAQPAALISPEMRAAFYNKDIVRAITYLGSIGAHDTQTSFIRAFAESAVSDADLALASDLALKLNRPDISVWAARVTRGSGGIDFLRAAFPTISVSQELSQSWTMVHAIARQETNFDIGAVSRTKALGLMQIEPYTARNLATRHGIALDIAALTTDPAYNMRLGAIYYSEVLAQFSGCHICAIASYNAGPHRVRQWIARFGDPRTQGADVMAWIDKIPFEETRTYVRNVLQNAVVYDQLNPNANPNAQSNNQPLLRLMGLR